MDHNEYIKSKNDHKYNVIRTKHEECPVTTNTVHKKLFMPDWLQINQGIVIINI